MNFHRSVHGFLLLAALLTPACGASPATHDSGGTPVTDASSGDAGSTDAGMLDDAASAADATVVRVDGGSPASEVERCEAAAASVIETCEAESDRVCSHSAVAMRCGSERADVLADAFDCLYEWSAGTGSCRTFGDPSGASDCLADLRDSVEATHATTVAEHIVARCTDASVDDVLRSTPIPMVALSDATLDALDACITPAVDCEGVRVCLFADADAIAACYR